MTGRPRPVGRYAPSPTGEIHLGNASTALLAWLSIRSRGGSFVMRMEDLDRPRVRPGLARQILDDLAWLGIDWDEGPDVGGEHGPYDQSLRDSFYDGAFSRLQASGLVYPCFCSRKDIAAAASAPQLPGDELRYPETCRRRPQEEALGRISEGERHAWRLKVSRDARPRFQDRIHGPSGTDARESPGDFVVRRSDGLTAYHLAVVVDDTAMGIDEIVRGDDLLSSTARQVLLYEMLGYEPPVYGHVPLLLGRDGIRLSKRHQGITLRELRDQGFSPERIVGGMAALLGLQAEPEPKPAAELVDGFDLQRIRPVPGGIVVDPSRW